MGGGGLGGGVGKGGVLISLATPRCTTGLAPSGEIFNFMGL